MGVACMGAESIAYAGLLTKAIAICRLQLQAAKSKSKQFYC